MRMLPQLTAAILLLGTSLAPAQAQTPMTGNSGVPTTPTAPNAGTATSPRVTAPAMQPSSSAATSSGTGASGTASTSGHRHRRSMAQRFQAANTTNDGHLTKGQAEAAHWKRVVTNFSAMDKGSKGYVTLADIQAYNRAQRAARRAHRTTPGGAAQSE